jgi:kynurenine formamidase
MRWNRALCTAAAAAAICGSHDSEAIAQALDLARARVIDLTHAFDDTTLYWPTSPSAFRMERLAWGPTPGGYFYAAFAICTPEHGGTHLDAPLHFAEGAASTAELPLKQLIAPAVVIDVTRQAAADRSYRLVPGDVEQFEREHGRIGPGTAVLIRTDWSRFWPERKAYFGSDTPGDASNLRFPGIGADAMRLIVEERKAALVGIDTASIDYGPSSDFVAHRIGAARGVPNLENLTSLSELPPRGAVLIALPMKIAGGSGGPVRVVALVP